MTVLKAKGDFRGFAGIVNNDMDPSAIPDNALLYAMNVDVHNDGRLSRRVGRNQLVTGTGLGYLKNFPKAGVCLLLSQQSLYSLNTVTYAKTLLMANVGSMVDYAEVNGEVYFTGPDKAGVVVNGAATEITASPREYTAATETTDTGKTINELDDTDSDGLFPAENTTESRIMYTHGRGVPGKTGLVCGYLICYYRGRLFIANGSTIYYSDPYFFRSFDLFENRLGFAGVLTMMRPTHDGIYLSYGDATYFMSGSVPSEFNLSRVMTDGAIFGTGTVIEGARMQIGDQAIKNDVVMWATRQGICMGLPGGQTMNLTQAKYNFGLGEDVRLCAYHKETAAGLSQFVVVATQ